jgi:hypothetical protein
MYLDARHYGLFCRSYSPASCVRADDNSRDVAGHKLGSSNGERRNRGSSKRD